MVVQAGAIYGELAHPTPACSRPTPHLEFFDMERNSLIASFHSFASSAEFVGGLWFGESSKRVK
jgi:hypothetical protein